MNKTSEGMIQKILSKYCEVRWEEGNGHHIVCGAMYPCSQHTSREEWEQFLLEAVEEARREGQVDVLQRQCGVMGKYNCIVGCEFDKKYFDLAIKEISKLEGGKNEL